MNYDVRYNGTMYNTLWQPNAMYSTMTSVNFMELYNGYDGTEQLAMATNT